MSIRDIICDDVLNNPKRNDHIIFSLNTIGTHPKGAGYGFVARLVEDYCADLKDTGPRPFGDIVSHEVPEHHLWLHGIVNHDPIKGWPDEGEISNDSYLATLTALNQLYEKWDDELSRPMKSLYLGRGKMRRLGDTHGNIIWMMQMMASAKMDLDVYILDGYDL